MCNNEQVGPVWKPNEELCTASSRSTISNQPSKEIKGNNPTVEKVNQLILGCLRQPLCIDIMEELLNNATNAYRGKGKSLPVFVWKAEFWVMKLLCKEFSPVANHSQLCIPLQSSHALGCQGKYFQMVTLWPTCNKKIIIINIKLVKKKWT